MNLPSLRRWQWILIGCVAGLLVGWGRLLGRIEEPTGGKGFITQSDFEAELVAPRTSLGPLIDDVVIHPSRANGRIDVVTMTRLDWRTQEFREYRFAAPRPYMAAGKTTGPQDDYTVHDYLAGIAVAYPAVTFREAWWERPWFVIGLSWLIGVVVIGEICPTLLRLRAAKDEPNPQKGFAFDAAGDKTQENDPSAFRAAIQSPMVEAEIPVADYKPAVVIAPVTVAVRPLEKLPISTPQSQPKHDTEYEGVYYPVEKHHPRGFSLIEVLVVIGIIAILISILLPAMSIVRTRAQATQCAAQLRQVGMALHMYANSNGGWLPAWSGSWQTWNSDQDQTAGPAWTVELIPYIGNPDAPVYNCPSFPSPRRCRNYFLETQWSGRSSKNAMKLSDITMGGRFVLSGDKTNMSLYPSPSDNTTFFGEDDSDPDDHGPDSEGLLAWPWNGGLYMHRTGNNVLFDDLHVALFSREDPAAMTFNPHRMESWQDVTPN